MLDLSGKMILVVDDEAMVRETLMDEFSVLGATVQSAKNGQDAFELMEHGNFDLVISDIRMPECSGIDLLKLIRQSDKKMPPVIMLSAFQDLTRNQLKELGARDFILKTEDHKKMHETIQQVLF